jgi:hypothetical protein
VPVERAYTFPYVVRAQSEPAWFTRVAPHLAPNTVVLAYPYPTSLSAQAVGWQALDGFTFRLVGGYDFVPGRDGVHSENVVPIGGAEATLRALTQGPRPPADETTVVGVRRLLQARGVDVVVVTGVAGDPRYAVGFLTAVLGRAPRLEDGSWVWYGVGHAPSVVPPAGALDACVARPAPSAGPSLDVGRCVLGS